MLFLTTSTNNTCHGQTSLVWVEDQDKICKLLPSIRNKNRDKKKCSHTVSVEFQTFAPVGLLRLHSKVFHKCVKRQV